MCQVTGSVLPLKDWLEKLVGWTHPQDCFLFLAELLGLPLTPGQQSGQAAPSHLGYVFCTSSKGHNASFPDCQLQGTDSHEGWGILKVRQHYQASCQAYILCWPGMLTGFQSIWLCDLLIPGDWTAILGLDDSSWYRTDGTAGSAGSTPQNTELTGVLCQLHSSCAQHDSKTCLHMQPLAPGQLELVKVRHLFQGLYSLRRRRLTGMGIPMINLRRSDDRLRFIMGIPILIRRRLLSE